MGQARYSGWPGMCGEWGSGANLVRDVRIAQIYEGTNGIQALDLNWAARRLPITAHSQRVHQEVA